MSEFLTKLKEIDSKFNYESNDNYANDQFGLDWLENDLYAIYENNSLIDVMNEAQIINFLSTYYNL